MITWPSLYGSLFLFIAFFFTVLTIHTAISTPQTFTEDPYPAPSRFLRPTAEPVVTNVQLTRNVVVRRPNDAVDASLADEQRPSVPLPEAIKQLSNDTLWRQKDDSALQWLKEATRYSYADWEKALEGFQSDQIHRGHISGAHTLEQDKVHLEAVVRRFQEKMGPCGGPEVVPRTFKVNSEIGREDFCKQATSPCAQKNPIWIMKPKGGAFGMGVRKYSLANFSMSDCVGGVRKLSSSSDDATSNSHAAYLAQRFISNPLKMNGLKVEIRFHVLIASTRPWIVLYHPDFIAKHATKAGSLKVNTHHQRLESMTPEELPMKLDRGNDVLKIIREQLKRMARLAVYAHRDVQGFKEGGRLGNWAIYGLDVALDEDLRAYLLDWNVGPGLGMRVHGSRRQSAATIRDMYAIASHRLQGHTGKELRSRADSTSWEVIIDESDGSTMQPSDCSESDPAVQKMLAAWQTSDKTEVCSS